jgi:hypothetical protein
MEAARVMAQRVMTHSESDDTRLQFAFELVTTRTPDQEELDLLSARLSALRKDYQGANKDAKLISSIGEYPVDTSLDATEHAAFTALCSVLLNLDETLTRQ